MDAPPESLGAVPDDHGWRFELVRPTPTALVFTSALTTLGLVALGFTVSATAGGTSPGGAGVLAAVVGATLVAGAAAGVQLWRHGPCRIHVSPRGLTLGEHVVPAHALPRLQVRFRGATPPQHTGARAAADVLLGEHRVGVHLSRDEAAWLVRAVDALRDHRPDDERAAEEARVRAALAQATTRR